MHNKTQQNTFQENTSKLGYSSTNLEVARDHEQRALEDSLHYPRHVLLHRVAELLDGGGEQR